MASTTNGGSPSAADGAQAAAASDAYRRGMERLLVAVQELSLARELVEVQRIVRTVGRELLGCDGATFVLRDGDLCHYVDEDAIGPLWKGKRFPMAICISGWVMNHRTPVAIPDIDVDPRIPIEAYRPTFVKSLAMVPIRTLDPIGAIGNYWASPRLTAPEEIRLLQGLADAASVAMENVRIHGEIERRVNDRTLALSRANEEFQQISVTDELTGLYNRRGFHLLAGQAMRSGQACIIAFVDVDGLKRVNDSLGHAAGDALLVDVARVLRASFRQTDIVARLGGDEFCVLVPDPFAGVEALRASIEARFEEFNRHGTAAYRLSASIGVLEVGADADAPLERLIAAADAAMYLDKQAKRRAG